jgi:hypothetical protein
VLRQGLLTRLLGREVAEAPPQAHQSLVVIPHRGHMTGDLHGWVVWRLHTDDPLAHLHPMLQAGELVAKGSTLFPRNTDRQCEAEQLWPVQVKQIRCYLIGLHDEALQIGDQIGFGHPFEQFLIALLGHECRLLALRQLLVHGVQLFEGSGQLFHGLAGVTQSTLGSTVCVVLLLVKTS